MKLLAKMIMLVNDVLVVSNQLIIDKEGFYKLCLELHKKMAVTRGLPKCED